jgi:hypothetical protein
MDVTYVPDAYADLRALALLNVLAETGFQPESWKARKG